MNLAILPFLFTSLQKRLKAKPAGSLLHSTFAAHIFPKPSSALGPKDRDQPGTSQPTPGKNEDKNPVPSLVQLPWDLQLLQYSQQQSKGVWTSQQTLPVYTDAKTKMSARPKHCNIVERTHLRK